MLNSFFSKNKNDLEGYDFKKRIDRTPEAVILDVRTTDEFAERSIPGAVNINFLDKDFKEKIRELAKDKVYFVYCRSGNRSTSAVNEMVKQGFTAYNLVGGIGAWPE